MLTIKLVNVTAHKINQNVFFKLKNKKEKYKMMRKGL